MLIHVPEDTEAAAAARAAIMADKRLTYGALGLLLVILDHAPKWEADAGELLRRVIKDPSDQRASISALRPLVDELHDLGYLVRTRQEGADGRVLEDVEAFAVPQASPDSGGPHSKQVVYVIGQPGSRIAKIGTTSNLRARLRALQTGHPFRLEVLWSCPGGRRLESWLHKGLAPRRLEGEWFDFDEYDPARLVEDGVRRARIMGVE